MFAVRGKGAGVMTRAALYIRVSTEEQAKHGLSMDEQESNLRDYAKAHGMKVVDCYLDAGKSARKRYTKRPEFMRLLADIESDKIDMVLFIKLDRWFRNISDYYEVQRVLDAHNVTWRATQEDYETVTASGRFKVNIMLSVAQDEADRTSERIKFVFEGKKERNEPITGKVPRGYKLDGKSVVIDPATGPMVRAAFDMYLETGSISKVIKAYPQLELTYFSARYMFSNPAYMGQFAGISIPAIISQDEYKKADSLRGRIVRKTTQNRVYLFSGLLICPECGNRLGGFSASRVYKETHYYGCSSHRKMTGCPNNKSYNEEKIEEYMLDRIEAKVQTSIISRNEQRAVSHKSQRDAIQRKLSKLSELYISDLISLQDYKKQFRALNDELAAIPEDIPDIDIEALKSRFWGDWRQLYDDLPRDGKQSFWRKTVKKIYLSSDSVADFDLI